MKKIKYNNSTIHAVVMTALLTAIAVVISFFRIDFPIAGAPVMRVGFSGPFVRLSAILFGPVYGGISGGMMDILSLIIKPSGAYIPPLTLTAILNGVLVGFIWMFLKKYNNKILRPIYILIFSIVGIGGIVNYIAKTFIPTSTLGTFILSIGKKSAYAAEGFIIAAVIGFVLLIIAEMVAKKNNYLCETYLKIIISTGIPSLIVTTINTYILRIFMPALADKMFMIILIPRLLEDLLMMPVQAYIIVLFMNIYKKIT